MIPFDMVEPASLGEAMALLDPEDPTIRPVAGGTALMLMMKAGVFQPSRLVCLHKIEPEFARISLGSAGELRIGALATLRQLEHDANVAKLFPMLKNGLGRLSNPRVRNVARVGGALAHGDPHMDLPPMLTALGARITIKSPRGERELPLEQLYSGYYETVLEKNELITAVTVPALAGRKAAYMKVTSRTAEDWPSLGVAVTFALEDGALRDPIVVASAATEKVTRMTQAERLLQGAAAEDAMLKRAGDAAAEEASILSDAHGSAAYKRELLRVYLRRAVRHALGQDMRQVA
ncbi:MAG TPA: xanthine dehydrogenase family protein subunit M [Xanthobacteraceae bacterium]|nr:xanthine dehydrogenase family protein subunit M [Xanthobacteraceae bacterium]